MHEKICCYCLWIYSLFNHLQKILISLSK